MSAGVTAGASLLSALSGIGAQKKAANAAASQAASAGLSAKELRLLAKQLGPILTQQIGLYSGLTPGFAGLGEDAIRRAREYDPGKETEDATRAFDVAANESFKREMSDVRLPLNLRGLRGSSEDATQTTGLGARRAFARAKYVADLRAGESGRKMAMLGQGTGIAGPVINSLNPIQTAQGMAGILGGSAQTNANLAQMNYGNASSINPFAALAGVNWDFLKPRRKPSTSGYAFT